MYVTSLQLTLRICPSDETSLEPKIVYRPIGTSVVVCFECLYENSFSKLEWCKSINSSFKNKKLVTRGLKKRQRERQKQKVTEKQRERERDKNTNLPPTVNSNED